MLEQLKLKKYLLYKRKILNECLFLKMRVKLLKKVDELNVIFFISRVKILLLSQRVVYSF